MTNQEQYNDIWEKANKYSYMTNFEKWCKENIIGTTPIDVKRWVVCNKYANCDGCPLYGFDDCTTGNPDVIKWFMEGVKDD